MADLERKVRLAEIPKLRELLGKRLAEIGEQLAKLEAERARLMDEVVALGREELDLMRKS